jgi:hypothetical protein
MEDHHVAGKWASPDIIKICRNCHGMIEAMRRPIDPVMREIAGIQGLKWVPLAVGWVLVWIQWLRCIAWRNQAALVQTTQIGD